MHFTCLSVPHSSRWLMMVSTTMAVLPVCRSPMMSSRWPRPIGVIASMDLMPVWRGSFTGWRGTTDGACTSRGRVVSGDDGTLAVQGPAEGVDHPAEQAVADRDGQDAAGPLDRVALLDVGELLVQDHAPDLVLVQVRRQAELAAGELEELVGHRPG